MGKSYWVATEIGNVQVIANDENVVCVLLGEQQSVVREHFAVNVRGIEYFGRLFLSVASGKVGLYTPEHDRNGYQALYVNDRWNGKKNIPASSSVKSRIKEVVIPAVQRFFDEHPEVLIDASEAELRNKIERQAKVVDDLTDQLSAAQGELILLQAKALGLALKDIP